MAIGIGNITQGDPFAGLVRRVADLERLVREQAAAPTLQNSTIGTGGIQLVNGGTVTVIDSGGTVTATLGALPAPYNRADGSPQPGLLFNRPDGSLALLLGDRNATTAPYSAAVQVIDRLGGRVVLADDTNSGHGLANPHVVAYPMQDTNIATWPATTANVWTDICDCFYEVQNPRLQWAIVLQADAGTTGQFRLIVNGTQIGTTQTVTGGFAYWQPSPVSLLSIANIGDNVLLEIDAQRTAGTGTVRALCRWMTGTQS